MITRFDERVTLFVRTVPVIFWLQFSQLSLSSKFWPERFSYFFGSLFLLVNSLNFLMAYSSHLIPI